MVARPVLHARQAPVPAPQAQGAQGAACEPKTWTTAEDHQNMMDQLGIKALRPGPSGNEQAPNHANYDEALANPFPDLPDVLTLKNGRKVTTAGDGGRSAARRSSRTSSARSSGACPPNVPKVTWTVTETGAGIDRRHPGRRQAARRPRRQLGVPGHHRRHPADARHAGRREGPGAGDDHVRRQPGRPVADAAGLPAGRGGFPPAAPAAGTDPPATEQLIADGWGFAFLNPDEHPGRQRRRADARHHRPRQQGAAAEAGRLGLAARLGVGRGARRSTTSRPTATVDAKRVGIEGVSRYGKAALVTMAFEPRFAVVLVGSSGEGGAKLHRRNFGEAVENLTGSGEYHWMAGNFLKYGASEATFGSKNAGDIPVDAHELIALCAPRLTFISYGVPEKGDAKWLDQQGSYMATVAAGPVFRLLGAKDLGVSDDYKTEKMPPVNVGLLDGQLAWRQHDGGHTDGPNWKYFIPWANRLLGRVARRTDHGSADRPAPRADQNSTDRARAACSRRRGRAASTSTSSATPSRAAGARPTTRSCWRTGTQNFFGWNAANFGWGADRTREHPVAARERRARRRQPEGHRHARRHEQRRHRSPATPPRWPTSRAASRRSSTSCRRKAPQATIVLTAIFPRNDNMAVMPEIRPDQREPREACRRQARCASSTSTTGSPTGTGELFDGMMNANDKLHPTLKGYQVWADALKPIFTELLGPPAATDHAPPPTGDPSAKPK